MSCFSVLHFPALRDDDGNLGLVVRAGGNVLNFPYYEKTVEDTTEHDVLPVEKITFGARNEELGSVCVPPTVCLKGKIMAV